MEQEKLTPQYVPRDLLAKMEIVAMLAASVVLMVLSLASPAPLGEIADPTTAPPHVSAPWIFAGIQELLKFFPPLIGGILIPAGVFLLVAAVPFLPAASAEEGFESVWTRLLPVFVLFACLLVIVVLTAMHFIR